MIALVALFLAGLMIGRTPAYLGKKVQAAESKMIMLYILAGSISILLFTALAVLTKAGLAGLVTNTGTHGFTEILFAYASANANNGQNFAGLNAEQRVLQPDHGDHDDGRPLRLGDSSALAWQVCSPLSSRRRIAPARCLRTPGRSQFC